MIRNWTDLKIHVCINPLSPNGDQHQFSPKNIHTLSRDKVMRIYEMITKGKNALICYQMLPTNS